MPAEDNSDPEDGTIKIILNDDQCKDMFMLYEDEDLFHKVKTSLFDHRIIYDAKLLHEHRTVKFIMNPIRNIAEEDFVLCVNTTIKNNLYKDQVSFRYPLSLNDQPVDIFTTEMNRNNGALFREQIRLRMGKPMAVKVNSVVFDDLGEGMIYFYGTKKGVAEFKAACITVVVEELHVEDRDLIRRIDNELVGEWSRYNRRVDDPITKTTCNIANGTIKITALKFNAIALYLLLEFSVSQMID